jgi:hypothetical protein
MLPHQYQHHFDTKRYSVQASVSNVVTNGCL